jgi:4-hydroxy-tetrahydrodipicolinate synthase
MTAIGTLLTALIVPAEPGSGTLRTDWLKPLIDHQCEHGVDGLFVLGTAGQGPLPTVEERKAVFEAVAAAAAGRLRLVCQVGGTTTEAARELARHAARAGASAIASVPPVYYSPDQRTVDDYYGQLIDATDLPLLAYDNPKATGYAFTAGQLARLGARGLAGAKVARGEITFIQELIAAGLPVWTANADLNAAGHFAGAAGSISTISNVAPALFRDLRAAARDRDVERANDLQRRVTAFARDVRRPIIGGLHYGCARLGLPAGAPRPPLRMPDQDERATIDAALRREQLLP